MTYGIKTTVDDLTTLSETTVSGRVFVELIYYETETAGTTHVHTYEHIPGDSYLRVHQLGGGTHTWATSTNGSGQAVITLTAVSNPSTFTVPFTLLIVFSTRTSETGYGILTSTASGDTAVSALYAVPEFLGKVTLNSTPTYSWGTGDGGYTASEYSATTMLGAGRERLVFWAIPPTDQDVWFLGEGHITASITGAATFGAIIVHAPGSTYALPEAYIFALDGLQESAETMGMRVYNQYGDVTFDSGRVHLNLKAIESQMSYPTIEGSVNTYTSTEFTGFSKPCGTMPEFRQEVYSGGVAYVRAGVVRLATAGFQTRLMRLHTYLTPLSGAYNYGQHTNLVQAVINSEDYEITSFALAGRVTRDSGTAECSYDPELGGSSCTSTSVWKAYYSGGTGSSITYAWSLVSNTGGLSISGSSSGSTVTLTKTGSGTSTYSCTLRCVITSGSSSVTVDTSVTHTHNSNTTIAIPKANIAVSALTPTI